MNPNTYENIKHVLDKIMEAAEAEDPEMTDNGKLLKKLLMLCSDGMILQEAQSKIEGIVPVVAFGHVYFKFSTIVRRILMAFFRDEYILVIKEGVGQNPNFEKNCPGCSRPQNRAS